MHPDDTDRKRLENGRRTPDVVEMRMGDHEQVEPLDTFTPEMPHDVRVRLAGVDEHRGTARTQQERVPLADIEDRQRERGFGGRDAVARATCSSRGATDEQQDEDEREGRHPRSLHAAAPTSKVPRGTCGEP
jgi:hypothetical protein